MRRRSHLINEYITTIAIVLQGVKSRRTNGSLEPGVIDSVSTAKTYDDSCLCVEALFLAPCAAPCAPVACVTRMSVFRCLARARGISNLYRCTLNAKQICHDFIQHNKIARCFGSRGSAPWNPAQTLCLRTGLGGHWRRVRISHPSNGL
jgi:hypothetical protein